MINRNIEKMGIKANIDKLSFAEVLGEVDEKKKEVNMYLYIRN